MEPLGGKQTAKRPPSRQTATAADVISPYSVPVVVTGAVDSRDSSYKVSPPPRLLSTQIQSSPSPISQKKNLPFDRSEGSLVCRSRYARPRSLLLLFVLCYAVVGRRIVDRLLLVTIDCVVVWSRSAGGRFRGGSVFVDRLRSSRLRSNFLWIEPILSSRSADLRRH
jgi:hypothetical protein